MAAHLLPEVLRLAGLAIAAAFAVVAVERLDGDTARGPARFTVAGPQPHDSGPMLKVREQPVLTVVEPTRSVAVSAGLQAVADVADEPAADSILASLALSDPEPAVREEALLALSAGGGSVALQTLSQAIHDEQHPRVRKAAVRALGEMGGAEVEQALVSTLSVADPGLLLEAIDALGIARGPAARVYLEPMLQHENDVVREAAAEWMAELSVVQ
jgi:HEAT repeat protein